MNKFQILLEFGGFSKVGCRKISYNRATSDGSNYNRVNSDGSNYNWGPSGIQYLALCVRVLARVADRAWEKEDVSF